MIKCSCKKFPKKYESDLKKLLNQKKSLAGKVTNLWQPNKKIKIFFETSEKELIEEILFVANEWSNYSSIKFVYEKNLKKADIHLTLKKDFGFYSAIGLQSKVLLSKNKPSMNLDPNWGLEKGFSEKNNFKFKYCKAMVIHEFGHALGFIHEHQREDRPFEFNIDYIKNNYLKMGMPSYKAAVENIIKKYSINRINYSDFDYKSIMIYPFKGKETLQKISIEIPLELSKNDKNKVGKIYN